MAKKYPDKKAETFAQSDGANFKQSEPKRYEVTYRKNASMEIYVGGTLIRFEAHKKNPVFPEAFRNGVPYQVINHPDFQSVRSYFSITEIKGG